MPVRSLLSRLPIYILSALLFAVLVDGRDAAAALHAAAPDLSARPRPLSSLAAGGEAPSHRPPPQDTALLPTSDLEPLSPPASPVAGQLLITEFMAEANGARRSSTLLDENGEPADWIELHNAGASAADISGWFLTDKQDNLVRWQFPAGTILPSAGYLVVFASGKDRTAAGAPLHTNFSLDRDGEFLALVDSDRSIVASFGPDFPYQFMGAAYGLAQSAGSPGGYAEQPRYLVPATPGHANGAQGPSIAAVAHEPNLLPTGQDLTVRATIAPPAPDADIILHYRFGFDAEQQVTMTVQAAGTFSAQIHTGTLPRGTLVRYYVTATNRGGGSAAPASRWPLPCERLTLPAEAAEKPPPANHLWLPMLSAASAPGPDTVGCPECLGTVVGAQEIEEQSRLPILHWYVPEDPIYGWEWYRAAFDAHIEAGKPVWLFHDVGTRAAVFFAGQLYDNVFVEVAGAGTLAFSKKKLNFEFNHDQRLVLKGTEIPGAAFDAVEPFDKVHFPSTGWDESYVRQALAWRTYARTGAPHSLSFVLRLQQNGAFFSVTTFVEHPHKRFLVRNGLEPDGTTFKMTGNSLLQPPLNSTEEPTAGAYQERPDRLDREQALKNLIAGINLDPGYGDEARVRVTAYLYDHVDIPGVINYMATRTVLDDFDTLWHNYLLHQDLRTNRDLPDERFWSGTGEWTLIPWDKDYVFKRISGIYPRGADHPLFGATGYGDSVNGLFDALLQDPALRAMYLRRLRTVMDLVLAPDAKNSWLSQYAQELLNQVSADARQDSTLWTGAHVAPTDKPIARFDPAQLLARIEERRRELYNASPGGYGSLIPSAQIDPQIAFGAGVEAGQVAQSALTLVNCSMTAVDISNWTLTGGKGHSYQFKPGVVIPGNGGRLYVTPDVRAFRTNQLQQRSADLLGLFVQGGFPVDLLGTIQGGRLVRPPYALRDGIHLVATSVGPGRPCP